MAQGPLAAAASYALTKPSRYGVLALEFSYLDRAAAKPSSARRSAGLSCKAF
jgi:hypothetical protein